MYLDGGLWYNKSILVIVWENKYYLTFRCENYEKKENNFFFIAFKLKCCWDIIIDVEMKKRICINNSAKENNFTSTQ